MSSRRNRRQAQGARHYFDAVRNYDGIAKLEHEFFSLLLKKKNELTNVRPIQQAIKDSIGFVQDPKSGVLKVLVDFEVYDNHRRKRQTMFLGTKLEPKAASQDAQVTHCICLSEEQNWIAKIHLDRDFSSADLGGKPTPHIQVGGRPLPQLQGRIRTKPFWRDDVDKPRVPSIPFCTVLLWHWAFLEYGCDKTVVSFVEDDWWKRLVHSAEEAILKPFFADGVRLLTDKPASGLLKAFYTPLAM